MPPLIPFVAGLATLLVGVFVLRTYGPGYRVGRLLAATRSVTIAEALALANGPARYVRVSGRIDAEDEFEDDAHRPLVFRRTRLQLLTDGSWVSFEDRRERVDFDIGEGLDAIGVDDAALDTGLVVVLARVGRDRGGRRGSRAGGDRPDDPGPPPDRAGLLDRTRPSSSACRALTRPASRGCPRVSADRSS